MSVKYMRYKHNSGTMEPDANGEWVKWDDFQSSRLNIKQMKKDRDDAEKRETLAADMAVRYLQRAEAAEAKLAKAVEALREIETDCDADYPPSHGAIKYAIRTALAELEGEK